MSNNNTWIDLTDMLTWKGHFTGIQRVVYEISKEYISTARFFYFDETKNAFFETEFPEFDVKVLKSDQRVSDKKVRIVRFLQTKAPHSIIRSISPRNKVIIRKTARKTYSLASKINRSVSNSISKKAAVNNSSNNKKLNFKSSDTVMILGAGWHKQTMIIELKRQKLLEGFNLVHIVYDLIPVYFPHFFGPGLYEHYTRYLFEAISICDQLVAISESTKKDVLRFCNDTGLICPGVEVIRLGEDFSFEESDSNQKECVVQGDYILCVGTFEVRKNHSLLYQAYRYKLGAGIKMPKLVIVGRHGWLVDDLIYALENDPIVKDRIIYLKSVSDQELKNLYTNCLFTVYPSFYEGWGLPIAESLAYRKLCLASETSSMTEVAGGLIEYFSPYNAVELSDLIQEYSSNPKILKDKEFEIALNYKPTSWYQTANEFKRKVRL